MLPPPCKAFILLLCLQDGFVEFFQVSDPECTVRSMLLAVAGVAGLGATLAMLIR